MLLVVAVSGIITVEHGLYITVERCEVFQITMGEDDALDANEILSDALVILQLCHTVRRVLALSNRLRVETHLLLQVIATVVEGVETNNQNYLVERAGVDFIQGFLYSRPLPPQECIELLKRTGAPVAE